MYDFDSVINRNTPDDIKYEKVDGIDDLIPMWVADMDLKSPPEVIAALEKVATNGIYGYSQADKAYYDAVTGWFKRRFDWDVTADQIITLPGVIMAITYSIRVLTKENDHVMIFEPVYGPFRRCVEGSGRSLTVCELKERNGHYEVDLDEMRRKIVEDDVKLLVWCSPHNPGGRVWTYDELKAVSDICLENDVFIVSDEIHADLTLGGRKHIPMAKISDEIKNRCVVLTSPTKSFNIAGIQAANIIAANKEVYQKIDREAYVTGAFGLNKMGIAATKAAYNEGEKWLDELLEYIEGNVDLLIDELKDTDLKVMRPEGTYLVWIDCKGHKDFEDTLLRKVHIRVSEGKFFGQGGDGFIRVNVACPRSVLKEAIRRIKEVI